MLKRILMFLITLVLLLGTTSVFAETPDLSQMTFEELTDLRAQLNAEMLTRPEAEDIILPGGGEYVVGEDLLPGTYYFIYSDTAIVIPQRGIYRLMCIRTNQQIGLIM